jgi:hypothetical protein
MAARTPRRVLLVLVSMLSILPSACSGWGGGTSGASTSSTAGVGTSSTSAATAPSVSYAADPPPAAGPAPSFNESAGCGGPQGVRGPYVTVTGDLSDSEAIRGPWGDFYGRDIGEVRGHLVEMKLPMTGSAEVTVWVHDRVVPALQKVIENLEAAEARGDYYEIHQGAVSSFRAAAVPPHLYLSFHAMGAAIDINSTDNPYREDNQLITDMPDWFVKAWTDAGWCWGGQWLDVKDSMHFSWQGPLYASDYPLQAPIPPRTEAAPFTRSLTFPTVLGPAPGGSRLFVADMDRDGAPDAVRVHPWDAGGSLGIEIAQAMYDFKTGCTPLVTSRAPASGYALLMADGTGGGRPDLWEISVSGGRVAVTIYTFASGYSEQLRPRSSAVPSTAGAVFLAGDHNRDGNSDLYVVRPGSPVTLEVWRGPGFASRMLQASLPAEIGPGWQFALGSRDADGVPDLFAFRPDGSARLVIIPGSGDFTGTPEALRSGVSGHDGPLQVGDFDGDGRDDLYFLDGDGSLTVYLGGDRGGTPDEDLVTWFSEGTEQPETHQEGCPESP